MRRVLITIIASMLVGITVWAGGDQLLGNNIRLLNLWLPNDTDTGIYLRDTSLGVLIGGDTTTTASILEVQGSVAADEFCLDTSSPDCITSWASAGGGSSNWTFYDANTITPTTTVGILVGSNTSSTVGNLTMGNSTSTQSTSTVATYSPLGTFDKLNFTNATGTDLQLLGDWVSQQGNFNLNFTDNGSDAILTTDVGGINSFFIDTSGTFLEMVANPGPANDYEMFAFEETQGDDTAINFYEGGTGHNRIWNSGSMRLGGTKGSACSTLPGSLVDCDTSGTGADLIVQDDIQSLGMMIASSTNFTMSSSTQMSVASYLDLNGATIDNYYGTACGVTNEFITDIADNGTFSCTALDTTGTWSGNAGTATALASNGANCLSGNSPLGVDASGASEGCFDVWTEAENTSAGYISDLSGFTTTDLTEGTNLYYTDGRVADYINASTTLQSTFVNANNLVTLAGEDYLSLSSQQITANAINADNLSATDFGDFTCNGTTCSLDGNVVASSEILLSDTYDWTGLHTYSAGIISNSSSTLADLHSTNLDLTGNLTSYWSAGCTNQFMTDIADDGTMSCATVDISAMTNATSGNGVTVNGDSFDFDCSDVTDSGNDGVSCSTEDIVVGGGRSLTTDATNVIADAELYTDTKCAYIESPTAETLASLWTANIAGTVTGISCESDDTVTLDLQIDDGTPADINGSDISCTSTWAEDTTLAGDTTIGANEHIDLVIASGGSATWVSVCWEFTYDD